MKNYIIIGLLMLLLSPIVSAQFTTGIPDSMAISSSDFAADGNTTAFSIRGSFNYEGSITFIVYTADSTGSYRKSPKGGAANFELEYDCGTTSGIIKASDFSTEVIDYTIFPGFLGIPTGTTITEQSLWTSNGVHVFSVPVSQTAGIEYATGEDDLRWNLICEFTPDNDHIFLLASIIPKVDTELFTFIDTKLDRLAEETTRRARVISFNL